MNIYEKLQTARVELQKKKLPMSGKNTFNNYEYYQLKDFLPELNELCKEHKIISIVNFDTPEYATLTLINTEKTDEQIVFVSPARRAQVKGAQDIQNLGAEQTYQRRYLYLMAFEIVVDDAIDKGQDKTKPNNSKQQSNQSSGLATSNQIKKLYAMSKSAKMDDNQLKEFVRSKTGKVSSKELTANEIQGLFKELETKLKGVA